MKFPRQFLLFGLVGSVGFVLDTAVLYLISESVGLYWGRLFSFATSVFVTWILNRNLTFADRRSDKPKHHELIIYFLLMALGGLVNYATYVILILNFTLAHQQPVWGVAAGGVTGMLLNLFSARHFLFKIHVLKS